ncbi:RidA family protein [Paraflavitalea speifideaquila]|uniref:RidA family protein n=1 Tax=Paraflavitalea speifideaquila TaxID=3076558 RepID=UPI0028F0B9EE|nr:RidA family protein [Paraflavitalea speifideiaquila]
MTITAINPASVPAPDGNYSQGLLLKGGGDYLFISGQIPEKADGTIPDDFTGQCETVWQNIHGLLTAAGMGFKNILKVTTYLTNKSQIAENSRIRQLYLEGHQPALTVIIAETLDARWMLEIEVIAVAP